MVGKGNTHLFMGDICRNVDIHDTKLLANRPVDVFGHTINLYQSA